MMLIKNELEQLKYLKKEIKLLNEELHSMNKPMISDKVTGSSSEFPYTKRGFMIEGIDVTKLDRMRRKLERKTEELMEEMDKLNDYIDTIEDSEMRQIMMLIYRNGLTWEEIGEMMGYHRTAIQKKHDAFLRE